MDALRFFQTYGVDYKTEGHKHTRQGWINCECPFCHGNSGYHLGYNLNDDYWVCWRCGWHSEYEVILALLRGNAHEAFKARDLFKSRRQRATNACTAAIISKIRNCPIPTPFALPESAQNYLLDRGFNPNKIAKDWGIFYSGSSGRLKYRIVIPIFYKGKRISYTARDITGLAQNKYMSASENIETYDHKKMLYGIDYSNPKVGLVVEGPIDVWRFGYGAVGTFGIKYTREQVLLMATHFKKVKVLYDADKKGQGSDRTASQKKAIELVKLLSSCGVKSSRCCITDMGIKDPGDLDQITANKFMSELFME